MFEKDYSSRVCRRKEKTWVRKDNVAVMVGIGAKGGIYGLGNEEVSEESNEQYIL